MTACDCDQVKRLRRALRRLGLRLAHYHLLYEVNVHPGNARGYRRWRARFNRNVALIQKEYAKP